MNISLRVKIFVDLSCFFDFDQGRHSFPGASCHGIFLSLPVAVLRAFACVVLAVFAPGQFPDVVLVHVLGLLLQLLHLLFLHLFPALRDGLANLGESVVGVDLGDLFPSSGRP